MFCFEVGDVVPVVDTVLERVCPFLGGVTGASLLWLPICSASRPLLIVSSRTFIAAIEGDL
jgi:hypothetical protein